MVREHPIGWLGAHVHFYITIGNSARKGIPMKKTCVRFRLGAALFSVCGSVSNSQGQIPTNDTSPTASTNSVSGATAAQGFQPGLADLMTMLVQPRHIRLFYAGSARNWELAEFELQELRSALRRTTDTLPRYQGADVNDAVATIVAPKLHALEVAINAADSQQFSRSYGELTAACNACHAYLEHPFLVIRVPKAGATHNYADQEFSSTP
jgi:hypothetical protein